MTDDQVWQCTHCGNVRVLSVAVRAPRCQGLYQLAQSYVGAPVDRSHWPLGMTRVGVRGSEVAEEVLEAQRAAEPVAEVDEPDPVREGMRQTVQRAHQALAGVPWWYQAGTGSIGAEEVL